MDTKPLICINQTDCYRLKSTSSMGGIFVLFISTDFFVTISLSLKERICTLHALCFGINKYIITFVEVNFISGLIIYAKK